MSFRILRVQYFVNCKSWEEEPSQDRQNDDEEGSVVNYGGGMRPSPEGSEPEQEGGTGREEGDVDNLENDYRSSCAGK
jgi:hypothetical protein